MKKWYLVYYVCVVKCATQVHSNNPAEAEEIVRKDGPDPHIDEMMDPAEFVQGTIRVERKL